MQGKTMRRRPGLARLLLRQRQWQIGTRRLRFPSHAPLHLMLIVSQPCRDRNQVNGEITPYGHKMRNSASYKYRTNWAGAFIPYLPVASWKPRPIPPKDLEPARGSLPRLCRFCQSPAGRWCASNHRDPSCHRLRNGCAHWPRNGAVPKAPRF
jgi:hypothetical protein